MTQHEAAELVQQFLQLMEARDLEQANSMISSDARIVFPGGKLFASQAEMVAAASGRYQWVKKTFDHIDVVSDGIEFVVYVIGTLHGVNYHGAEFSGIRYIDRFVVRGKQIVSQEVWNDLAESGVLERKKHG